MQRKIGIVGGGPGGLMSAYMLQKHMNSPFKITIYERSPRLGGKVITPRFDSENVRYEAGAAEIYDYSEFEDEDPLKDLIKELGLPITTMGGSSAIMQNQFINHLEDIKSKLGVKAYSDFLHFDQLCKGTISPQEFYTCDDPDVAAFIKNDTKFHEVTDKLKGPAKEFIEQFIHSDLATEPCHTSMIYGMQNYVMNDPAYMLLYSIEGGNDRLIHELDRRTACKKLLEHQVQCISKTEQGKYKIKASHHEQKVEEEFDYIIIALPHDALPSIKYEGNRLTPAMNTHFKHHEYPAHYLRVTIMFDTPFWNTKLHDSFCMLDEFGGCCLYDESSRTPSPKRGVLGWLLGGEEAVRLSELSDEELVDLMLEKFPTILGDARSHFLEGKVHRWLNTVNAIPGGLTPLSLEQRHQPEPVDHPGIFMVGDYLYDSTLNGVTDSAIYVSQWIAALTLAPTSAQPKRKVHAPANTRNNIKETSSTTAHNHSKKINNSDSHHEAVVQSSGKRPQRNVIQN